MKTLAIFDLDGTLVNTIDDLGTACNAALQCNGFATHTIDAYPRMVGNGVAKLIERALPQEQRTESNIAQLLEDFRAYYNSHLYDYSKPYDGIPELLAELHRRDIAIAVASNKYESAVISIIDHFFSDIPFVSICGNIDGVPPKPDPSIVFRILSQHPTPKASVIYIGDSAVDIETARRAAIDNVGVTWGFRPKRELVSAYADHIISNPADLLDII